MVKESIYEIIAQAGHHEYVTAGRWRMGFAFAQDLAHRYFIYLCKCHSFVVPSSVCIPYSVKATIERYKKACAESTNTGSVSEASTQDLKNLESKLKKGISRIRSKKQKTELH
ncbi:hypothetical protein Prudu_1453S000100 [Prunus dulcis]|uniref:Uncharacterized protein n=1 Tax=Prunus dulcis TaxID=3755 RepID=A0A5H2XUA1_PRUDU|nr:hypothetical protein Prudu_1453S000100 [Prunus dulcis]